MRSIRRKVLSSIQPSAAAVRGEQRYARRLASSLQRLAPRNSRVVVAGSVAKGTFLQNDKDIDIFLLLPIRVPRSRLEAAVANLVRRVFPRSRFETKYAEHPYVRLYREGRKIDIVPAYLIRDASQRISAVDRSVLHTRFIRSHLPRSLIPDVLLLKRFLKSAELYGAEIKVQGFSGYLCELLILRYRGFEKCLKAAARWRAPVFIDWGGQSRSALPEAWKRFNSPLIVIDPTDQNRNVAAAVSEEALHKFALRARRFGGKPSPSFFAPPSSFDEKLLALGKRKGSSYLIRLPHGPVVDDVLWGQLRKLAGQLQAFLENHGFEVSELLLGANDLHAHLAVRLGSSRLPPYRWVPGPGIDLQKHVAAFRKAHKNSKFKIRNRRVWACVRRPFFTADAAFQAFLASTSLPSHLEQKAIRILRV